jgi:integrase
VLHAGALYGQVHDGTYTAPTRQTTGSYLEQWLRDVATPRLRPGSLKRYREIVRVHLIPAFGMIPLKALGPALVQAHYAKALTTGVGAHTVAMQHRILRTALREAVRWNMLPRNPVEFLRSPRLPRRERVVWDQKQLRLFLAEAKRSSRYYELYQIALDTGLRQAELLGLRRRDLDLARGALSVQQALVRIAGVPLGFSEPKSDAGRRKVNLDPRSCEVLHALLVHQQVQRAMLGLSPATPYDLVFSQPSGRPLIGNYIVRNDFHPVCARAGVPRARFHDLRHTNASYQAALGVPLKVTQERLGHATLAITADVYQHTFGAQGEDAAQRLAAFIYERDALHAAGDGQGMGKSGRRNGSKAS